jgi:hypothetical protein
MSRTICTGCLAVAVLLAMAVDGRAQFQSGGTGTSSSSSGFGSSGFGSTGFNQGGFGSTGFGSTNLGNSGGFGSIGIGSGGFGGRSIGTGGFSSQGFGSQGFGSQGQMGLGQGGQQFVGRDASDMQSVFNNLGRNSNQFFQTLNRSMGANRGRQANQQQPENVRPPVHVQLRVAFDYARPTPTVVARDLGRRLEKVLAEHHVSQPEVVWDGGTATLRGSAANESQRMVLENLVQLEPGVSAVVNQMTLAPDTAMEPVDPESDN